MSIIWYFVGSCNQTVVFRTFTTYTVLFCKWDSNQSTSRMVISHVIYFVAECSYKFSVIFR